jgi:hypothetical protein
VTCDTISWISGNFDTDIGENADIGGGNNPDDHHGMTRIARGHAKQQAIIILALHLAQLQKN